MLDLELDPSNDGIDHIRIHSEARTQLGRFLVNEALTPFSTGGHDFKSMAAFRIWHASGRRDSKAKKLYGEHAVNVALRTPNIDSPDLDKVFEKMFLRKLEQTFIHTNGDEGDVAIRLLKLNALDYVMYDVDGGIIIQTPLPRWMITVLMPMLKSRQKEVAREARLAELSADLVNSTVPYVRQ